MAALDRSGKADNTLVIFLSDHGIDLLRGKRTCYEGGTRIPLIVHWPGEASPQIRTELVSTIDLMLTLLEVGGAAPVPDLPGRSLVPLLAGEQPEWRSHLFTEFHTHATAANFFPQRAVRGERYKLIENLLPGEFHPDTDKIYSELPFVEAVIAAAPPLIRTAYQRQQRPPRYELYDLQTDPYEFQDLTDSPEHAETFADLKQRLAQWREQSPDPLLDPAVLQRLKEEVYSVRRRAVARDYQWGIRITFSAANPKFQATPTPRKTSDASRFRWSSRFIVPALSTHGPGNHTVRSERWRDTRYADGGEELYNHQNDPHE